MIHPSRSLSSINPAMSPATPPRRLHANTITERPTTLPQSPPGRMLVSSPPHSPRHIQNHLYQMFLEGQTADVAVVVRGSWQALYNLHRVILIQSDYFRTLFTMGYRESAPKSRLAPGSASTDVIDLHFDDPNITRAAFEICIARLYGGGPDLFVDQALLPSTKSPFPISSPPALASAPPGSHPATPRFLLSLLATANYLNIPSVSNQALNLVLSTISPWTITRYFGFAIGHGIGQSEGNEPEAAVGLDTIGQPVPAETKLPLNETTKIDEVSPQEEDDDDDLVKVGSLGSSAPNLSRDRDISGASRPTCDTQSIYSEHGEDAEQTFFYGVVSDKVGEACGCWLTRWGADILALEEAVEARIHPSTNGTPPRFAAPFPKLASSRGSSHSSTSTIPATFSSFYANMNLQAASNSSSSLSSPSRRSSTPQLHPFLMSPVLSGRPKASGASVPTKAPTVWSHGGLPARWARAVMSSDNLFVRGEWERFVYMTRVVELRRRQLAREADAVKQDPAALEKIERLKKSEEREWDEMFKTGVYYSHISLEDLHKISQEASSNGKPFVELSALQSAHWRQSIMRSLITSRSTVSSSRSSSPTTDRSSGNSSLAEGELGGLVSAADILASAPDDNKVYYPIPSDASIRVGHDRSASTNGLDIDFDILSSPPPPKIRRPASEADLFGLRSSRRTAREIIEEGTAETTKWSTNEPFRFSVEFWGLDTLKEKNRLHSHTVWYAGSLYNVYVQVIKKKGMQLGVYLHRQSAVDPIPPASAPASFALLNPPTPTGNDAVLVSPSPSTIPLRSSLLMGSSVVGSPPTPTPRSGTTPPDRDVPVTSPPSAPPAPWRDPRRIIRSYFILSCPSLIGSSHTRFQSGPDDFKISQSWGWKSSCLWAEPENNDLPAIEDTWNSLRATVTIGVV
ncbi:hypothetical protein RSOLAG1IB_02259 [Rhizoctonia solani AG-1 IB]|uniref:BTB domain-containing protein n=1 Tax=Thanatephorus cucumeris (strain AG1-IB / isolate 7/3/14) TaxID=1108050 RepID=A0A0B7FMR6_THACB|nr:hypothetical protein RSOLAG1IB_02259 [Rhizoctonia solani AG-1 IB]